MSHRIKKIETDQAPKAVGPYSQALSVSIKNSRLFFVSGQLPLDPATGKLVTGGIEVSTKQVIDNLAAILEAAGSALNDVVRVEVFLKDLNDFKAMNEEYQKRFTGPSYPARQTIEVARLPLDAPIEISCIAIISE